MHFIAHRVNTIKDLKNIPFEYGVEVDLRDFGKKLILHHDPFKDGEDFEEYLKYYNHGSLILNIKSEGIEFKALEILKKNNVKKYFFLDSSFPMINQLSLKGEKNIALRFSEYEGIETISLMSKRVNWVWVDCFSKLPITFMNFKILKKLGYKLCLVSPELQDQNHKLKRYKEYLFKYNIIFDAICTKVQNIQRWES
jgi:hypothetical protein